MFCPNCGSNLPEGTVFCGNCGAPQRTQQAAQQPQYQPPVQPQPAPVQPRRVQPQAQKSPLMTIAFILSLVLLVASVIAPLTMPFFDIPAMSVILSVADADPDELTESMEQAYEEAEYTYDIQKQAMSKSEREDGKKLLDSMEKLLDNFSILNFTSLVGLMDDVGDDYLDSGDMDEIESISEIMSIVIGVVIGFFVLPLLFTLLGGLKKSTGLTVAALIFTAISQLILSGILWLVLCLAVNIFQIMQYSKLRKA